MKRHPSNRAQWKLSLGLNDELAAAPSLSAKIDALKKYTKMLLSCNVEIVLTTLTFQESTPKLHGISTDPAQPELDTINKNRDFGVSKLRSPAVVDASLVAHDKLLGVMHFDRNEVPFDDKDIELIEGLARQAAILIENELLLEYTKLQDIRLLTVSEISNAIASILDLDLLLNSVTSLVHKYFNFPYVYLFTVQQWHNKIQLRSGAFPNLQNDTSGLICDLDQINSIFTQVIDTRRTVFLDSLELFPPLSSLLPLNAHSELIIPTIFGDQVLGILWLRSEQNKAFSQTDIVVFEALGDNIAVAIRNANLYRSERWRRQVSESMRDVAGLLSTESDITHVLNQLLSELIKTLPSEIAGIWLAENIESESQTEHPIGPLQLAALISPGDDLKNMLDHLDVTQSDRWLTDILVSPYPLIRDNMMRGEPFGRLFNYPENYSAIFSSLKVGAQPIGILVLAAPQPARYGSEAQLIVATFANYTAIAIKNTRLYEVAHDQAWISTVLLQMAEATQTIDNLNDLLQTVVHTIPPLIGVNACAILLWDKTVEAFSPAASFGLAHDKELEFNRWYISKNDIQVFDRILASREPVILNKMILLPEEKSVIGGSFDLDRELFVLFPMVSQSDIHGVILVDFSENSSEYDYKLWDEKISIIQGIAHQTAMAVENIKLINSQEEEAYVSIALLQVAQAIVNAAQIDDVLSVIVRITPILVAMRRCAIFLWDVQKSIFYLSQSYGIPRAELTVLPRSYEPGDFPLLEGVRQRNQIACVLIDDVVFLPSNWTNIRPDDFLLIDPVKESSDDQVAYAIVKEILSSRQGLLLAYPLAVKDSVLGVMVTEEELSEHGIPNYHIRERRMEIMVGITQQASVAIQNDMLQREALKRERLDRELQLAQEIQINFMPDTVPHLHGWDLDVKWTPARQVGGDYYDIFELPEGKIGLAIADVADKGMPAALFMTLVRTLLRAAIRDNHSPAEILHYVNELLVPDAKNGMFVTIVYGILSPNTGEMIYANAGHVPPLLIHENGNCLLELSTSCMALGVLSGVQIAEYKITLLPGDALVFYTDGVTEAFSPDGDMFGSDRLKDLVLQTPKLSAKELSASIVNAVTRFTDSTTMSDDLTLIALYRNP